jgi:hypothetical protein
VQAAPTLSFKDSTPAFCTLATQEKLVDPTKPLEALEKLQADLRLLDLQWESESDEYLLLPFLGFSLLPSKTLSVVTALGLAFIWATVISAAIEIGANKWVCPLLVGVGFSVLLPMYVFARAHAHEKAEAEWLRKRVWLTAKANQAVTNK